MTQASTTYLRRVRVLLCLLLCGSVTAIMGSSDDVSVELAVMPSAVVSVGQQGVVLVVTASGIMGSSGFTFEFVKNGTSFCTSDDVSRQRVKFVDYRTQYLFRWPDDMPRTTSDAYTGYCPQSIVHKGSSRITVRHVDGASNATLAFSCVMRSDSGSYTAALRDSAGQIVATSNAIDLEVSGQPKQMLVSVGSKVYSTGEEYSLENQQFMVFQQPPFFVLANFSGGTYVQVALDITKLDIYAINQANDSVGWVYPLSEETLDVKNTTAIANMMIIGKQGDYRLGFVMTDTCAATEASTVFHHEYYKNPFVPVLIVASVLLGIFVTIAVTHCFVMNMKSKDRVGIKKFCHEAFDFFIKMSLEDVARKSGTEAAAYLILSKFSIYLVSVLTVLSFAVVLPIYLLSDRVDNPLIKFTYFNLNTDNRIWIIWAVAVIVCLAAIINVLFAERHVKIWLKTFEMSNPAIYHGPANLHTIWLKGIETGTREEKLQEFFEAKYPGEVLQVSILPRMDRILNAEQSLNKLTLKKRTPKIEQQLNEKHKELESLLSERPDNTRIALIVFKSTITAQHALESLHNSRLSALRAHAPYVEHAPMPEEIFWKNLHIPAYKRVIRVLLLLGMKLVVAALFYIAVSALWGVQLFWHYWVPSYGVQFKEMATTLFFVSLIFLVVAANVILPPIFGKITERYGHHTKVAFDMSVTLTTYVLVMVPLTEIRYIIVAPYQEMFAAVMDKSQADELFIWFTTVLYLTFFIASAIVQPAMNFFAGEMPRQKSEFKFVQQYCTQLILISLAMQSVIYIPLAVPIPLAFFFLKYYVDKYNLYYKSKPVPPRGHMTMFRTADSLFFISLINAWMGPLYLCRYTPISFRVTVIITASLIVLVGILLALLRMGVFWCHCGRCHGPISRLLLPEGDYRDCTEDVLVKAYLPPFPKIQSQAPATELDPLML
ncbi:hypothetical protein Pelo_12124 [Pelomyxa schiedti]|nr:hypothetical protein Pelo_12124 [Pelomyxa schiedti]